MPLACLPHAAIPEEADALLHGTPVEIELPPQGSMANTTHTQVVYSYQGSRLATWTGLACRPFTATQAGLEWFHDHGANFTLEIRIAGSTIASMPHLGQVAAAQANQGVITCG